MKPASSGTEKPSAVAIMGPTASGKSALALSVAKALDGEIVSADSMQLYRGMRIGTAKPSAQELASVPHHLLDILDFDERADLFSFHEAASRKIEEIKGRGRVPVVVGGTGLYMRALIYGLDPMPSDQTLRQELDALYDSDEGFEKLKERMAAEDPEDFAKWNAHRRKLIRSLEVFLLSGKSMSSALSAWKEHGPRRDFLCFKLVWERQALKRRIAERCDAMLAQGWLEEAEELLAAGLLASPTARQALGYSLIARHLSGELTLEELAAAIKTATWQYARRQTTWFKHQHPEAVELRMPSGPEPIIAAFEKARRP